MNIVNHVNLESLQKTEEKFKKDPALAKKINRIEGEWILDSETGPQFRAEIPVEKGTAVLESDQPTPLGGNGTRAGPMHYCLYGVAACFAATFATIAAAEGVILKRLKVTAEANMDLSRSFGLTKNPAVSTVDFKVNVETEGSEETIRGVERLAKERCPAVFCLTQPIELNIEVTKS
ncbi:MAG: OsmC family protein [Candidatus Hydrothermarchaeales archaeon]